MMIAGLSLFSRKSSEIALAVRSIWLKRQTRWHFRDLPSGPQVRRAGEPFRRAAPDTAPSKARPKAAHPHLTKQ